MDLARASSPAGACGVPGGAAAAGRVIRKSPRKRHAGKAVLVISSTSSGTDQKDYTTKPGPRCFPSGGAGLRLAHAVAVEGRDVQEPVSREVEKNGRLAAFLARLE